MGRNINQLLVQTTTFQNTDKMYLGRSPYNLIDDRYFYYSDLAAAIIATTGTFVTVGTGGQYATLYDAWTAGARLILVISNVTETQQFTFTTSGDRTIVLSNGDYTVIYNGVYLQSASNISVIFSFSAVNLAFNNTAGSTPNISVGGGSFVLLDKLNIGNVTNSTYMIGTNGTSTNITLKGQDTLFNLNGTNSGYYIDNLIFNECEFAGTTSNAQILTANASTVVMNNCLISGTMATGKFINAANCFIDGLVSNIATSTNVITIESYGLNVANFVEKSGIFSFTPILNGNLSNLKCNGTLNITGGSNIKVSNAQLGYLNPLTGFTTATVNLSNCEFTGTGVSTIDLPPGGTFAISYCVNNTNFDKNATVSQSDAIISGGNILGTFAINTGISGVSVSQITTDSNITVSGNYCLLSNCTNLGGNVTVANNATGSTISNNILQNGTITVNSGCSTINVLGNQCLTAVVDNGTNSQILGNTPSM